MFRTITVTLALALAACQTDTQPLENQEGFGEEAREAINSIGDGTRSFGEETKEAFGTIGERRTAFEKDVDRTTRDIEIWLDEKTTAAGETVDEGLTDMDRELDAIREDLRQLGQRADAEWEAGKADLERRIDALEVKVKGWDDPAN